MALAFLQEIGEASLQMDTISLNAAISACERPGGAGPVFSGGSIVMEVLDGFHGKSKNNI